MSKVDVTEIKSKIKEKFDNISRFSTLSKLPYHYIHNAFKKRNEMVLIRIEKAIKETENGYTLDEVDDELIAKVKDAFSKINRSEWCRENGVPQWWVRNFLRGDVRFKTHYRVKRMLELLGIEQ